MAKAAMAREASSIARVGPRSVAPRARTVLITFGLGVAERLSCWVMEAKRGAPGFVPRLFCKRYSFAGVMPLSKPVGKHYVSDAAGRVRSTYDPGAYKIRTGAVPAWSRGSG